MQHFLLVLWVIIAVDVITCNMIIRSIAGIPKFGGDGKLAASASIKSPQGIFVTSNKEMYISDTDNYVIRKVDKNGIISTIAGIPGESSFSGNGTLLAVNSTLGKPSSIYVTKQNEVYFCDESNGIVRKIDKNGLLSTVAGIPGVLKGKGANKLLANETTLVPSCVFVTEWNGEIFVCDNANSVIRKIMTNGTMIIVAGVLGARGYNTNTDALKARLSSPRSVVVTEQQMLYFADTDNNLIRQVNLQNNSISTFAGIPYNNFDGVTGHTCNYTGDGGNALNATFCNPYAIQFVQTSTTTSSLYIADFANCVIRQVETDTKNGTSIVSTIAGIGGICSYTGDYGLANNATLNYPIAFSVIPSFDEFSTQVEMWIADSTNSVIRKIDKQKVIKTVVGSNPESDKADPNLKLSTLVAPSSIQLTKNKEMYIADIFRNVIKKIDTNGKVSIVAGVLDEGGYNGDGMLATQATLTSPECMLWSEEKKELFICDTENQLIRKVDSNGIITTVAGVIPHGNSSNTNLATNTMLNYPFNLFLKGEELYISDGLNYVVWRVFLNNGTISKLAGQVGIDGHRDGIASESLLQIPLGIFANDNEEVYIADNGNEVIRKVDLKTGNISTLVGKNGIIYDDLFGPSSIQIINDNMYITDTLHHVIKRVNMKNGTVEIIAGRLSQSGFSGDNRLATEAKLFFPKSVIVSQDEQVIYFSDSFNGVIRKITHLCNDYAMDSDVDTSATALQIQLNRTCVTHEDYFLAEYLPLMQMKYHEIKQEATTIVVPDWNQNQQFDSDLIGQSLDILDLEVNGCGTNIFISQGNCTVQKEYGVIPTHLSTNYLIFPSIVSAEFLNYFRSKSSSISSLHITAQFINLYTNKTDATAIANNGLESVVITNLQHSTKYQVHIVSQVQYTNQLLLQSIEPTILYFETQLGIAPTGNLQQIELMNQNDQLLTLTWQSIPKELQGNVKIDRIEIQLSSNLNEEIELLSIPYEASTNTPSSYILNSLQPNIEYVITVRVCSPVGCSNFSDPMSSTIIQPLQGQISNTISIAISIIIIIGIVLCLIIIIAFTLLLLIIVVYLVLKRKKKNSKVVKNELEMMDEMISKEFRIDQNKIDLKNSKFLGSGASGSVITANYFNMEVAVKVIQKTTAGMENDLTDFYNELQFLNSNTRHENIIRFFGVYDSTTNNTIGLVMEYCSNGNIASYVMKHANLSFEQKFSLIKGIANGMQYLHFHNIAHRDLKCENVLLDSNLTPKIIDFGFSRVIKEEANKSMNLTMNIGTAAYCAPEVIKMQLNSFSTSVVQNINNSNSGNFATNDATSMNSSISATGQRLAYDKKCDIYSFAIMMWVIYFQNKNPYGENTNANQILYQISMNANFRPKVEEEKIREEEKWLIELMRNCWNTNPDQRPSFEKICNIICEKTK